MHFQPAVQDLLCLPAVRDALAVARCPNQYGGGRQTRRKWHAVRTICEEKIDQSEKADFVDAYQRIGQLIEDVYMKKPNHSSLGYLTRQEHEGQWRREQQQAVVH